MTECLIRNDFKQELKWEVIYNALEKIGIKDYLDQLREIQDWKSIWSIRWRINS